jgi:hypothetical protein
VPILENERHELFCQKLAEGKSATEAYVLAGFKPSRKNASRLRAKEDISARVAELQENAARSTQVTLESILGELDEALDTARSRGSASAMVSASAMKAKLSGLLVERQQIEVSSGDPFANCANVAEMADQMLGGLTNARWLEVSDRDRRELASIIEHWFGEVNAFLAEVKRRPLITEQQAKLLTNGSSRKQ